MAYSARMRAMLRSRTESSGSRTVTSRDAERRCIRRTFFVVEDNPASTDAFGGHERVASAIRQRLRVATRREPTQLADVHGLGGREVDTGCGDVVLNRAGLGVHDEEVSGGGDVKARAVCGL